MKKILILIIGLVASLPTFASAASFVMATTTATYAVGDTITLNISANPEGATTYTAMLDAQFSAGTLEVVSFTMNDKMLALKQDGYDALDNGTGVLIKTGGYPGGINTVTPFGTVVLRAKQVGGAVFTITDKSLLLDSKNADQQKGGETSSFTIVEPLTRAPIVTATSTIPAATPVPPIVSATPATSVPSTGFNTSAVTPSLSSPTGANNPVVSVDNSAKSQASSSSSSSSTTTPITQLAAVIAAAGKNGLALGSLVLVLLVIWSWYFAYTRSIFVRVVSKFRK